MTRGAALWALSRPRLAPYVCALPVVGFGWAHWDRALGLRGDAALRLLAVVVAWWALHTGTMWLNAALDRDEGEVLMGQAVAPPPGLSRWGYAALGLSVALGAAGGPAALAAVAGCAALAVLYSHPRTAWKGHPLGGPLVNVLGYGLLSPLAGFAAVGVPVTARSVGLWLLGAVGVLGVFYAAQVFQQEEDAARGYRTLVATRGPKAALLAARVALGVGFGGAVALALAGALPVRLAIPAALLGVHIDRRLAAWGRVPGGGRERHAAQLAGALLLAVLAALGLLAVDYVEDSARGRPVAGLSTRRARPPDRPLLSPAAMRAWEASTGRRLLPEGEAP